MSGTGVNLTVSPNPLAFGEVTLGTTSSPQSVTITNKGTANVTISSISSGDGKFVVSGSPALPASLDRGASVTFVVTFTPADTSTCNANLTIASSAPASSLAVPMSGSGADTSGASTYGFSTLQPSPWSFPAPSEVLGFNSSMTFGDSVSAVLGMSQSFCTGSNVSLNFNPASLLTYGIFQDSIPAALRQASGGIGAGSASFTFGDNLTFNCGQTLQANIGPSTNLVCSGKFRIGFVATCGTLALIMVALFYILFKVLDSDVKRAEFALICQGVIDVLLALMMAGLSEEADEAEAGRMEMCAIYGATAEWKDSSKIPDPKKYAGAAVELGALLATVAAPLAIAGTEVERNTNANSY
jgi:hypothetical protein